MPRPTSNLLFEIYKLLHSVFQQAVNWGYFTKHLTEHIQLKKPHYRQRATLTHQQIATAIQYALTHQEIKIALMIQMAFSCSMRKGEILGLCWEDVDLTQGTISINKELIRVSKASMDKLGTGEIYHVFEGRAQSKSQIVLKPPKTSSAIRTVYMPPSLVALLERWRTECPPDKANALVLTQDNGAPLCPRKSNEDFGRLLTAAGLPMVVFHSLRHSSTAYKLILSRGNLKAVQGDNGHAQPNMVLSVYARICDEDRKNLAKEMERQFCSQLPG